MEYLAGLITSIVFLVVGLLCIILPKKVKNFVDTRHLYERETDARMYLLSLRFFGLIAILVSGFILKRMYM